MSEEKIKEAFKEEQVTGAPLEEVIETPELSATEQKAWDQGWRPEEDFDGNPDNWKTAKEYVLYGEFQEQIRDVKNESRRKDLEFDNRITNLNRLHESQQQAAISTLKVQQRQAVEEADTARYDQLQTEIDGHKPIQPPVSIDPAIVAWEAKNPWINDMDDEKTLQAQAFFNVASARPNATVQTVLDYVDEQINKIHHKAINPRREMPTMTEQPTTPRVPSRKKRDLTINDLTPEEAEGYKQFGSTMFKSDKEFLKAVADARKE